MEAPCKDCVDRAYPKTCEQHCKRWIEYKKQHNEKQIAIKQQLIVDRLLWKHFLGVK